MDVKGLEYTAGKGEFISKWLISSVIEEPFYAEKKADVFPGYRPGVSVKDENGKERKSPAKKEFLARARFSGSPYPKGVQIEKFYYPLDTTRVDYSASWPFPTDITFYAKAFILADEAHVHEMEIYACGAVKLWINGLLQTEFYPYESNIEQHKSIQVMMEAGMNELVIGCNDYGERNIVFRFGLKNVGEEMKVSLPVSADTGKIERLYSYLKSFYLDRTTYTDGDIFLCSEQPFNGTVCHTVSAAGIERIVTENENKGRIRLFSTDELPMGYHRFRIGVMDEGFALSADLYAEVYQDRLVVATPKDYQERCHLALCFAVDQTVLSLDSFIASLALGHNDYERYRSVIETDIDLVRRRGDCADFRILRFVWLLKRYKNQISPDLNKVLTETLLGFRYWFDEPGNDAMWFFSENHALAFHTGELLAGELFSDETFSNSLMNGKEHAEKAKHRIHEWIDKLLEYGYNEWNSATYVKIDVLSYITLYCLTEDEGIREKAKKALDYTFMIYAYNSFKGVMGTSNGRTYNDDLLACRCMAGNSQMWLAWGVGNMNQVISPTIYIALSDYQVPEELRIIATWNGEKLIRKKTEGTQKVPTTLCKTSDYILGSCISPRTGNAGSQELLVSMFLNDTHTRIWINNPGEGKIFGTRRPGYFNGNAFTPLVIQRENMAVISYNCPKVALPLLEADYVHIMCDEKECSEVVLRDKWLFIRRDNAFAAIYSTNGISRTDKQCLREKEFISLGTNSTWLIKVTDENEVGNFEAFICHNLANEPVIQNNRLVYMDLEYGKTEFPVMEDGGGWTDIVH